MIGEDARIGNFVETKNTRVGKGAKAQHLSYLGDADIGAGSNIGAGVITCNYDGEKKHPTTIGEGAFVGSDVQLVAPVTVGAGAYVGAGTTVTEDVPDGALAEPRSPQVNKAGWARPARRKRRRARRRVRTRVVGRRTAALFLAAATVVACRKPEEGAESRGADSVAASPDRLVGRWLRSDADYTIDIASVGPDGKLEARYLNPGPIHVARAESGMVDGALRVFLELQDRGYPGSYYTLTYDPGSDSLTGVYHHLGINQQFEVAFSRLSPAP